MRKWLSAILFIVCAIGFSQSVLAQNTEYAFKGDLKAFSVNGAAGNTYVWKITHPDNSVETLGSTTGSSGDITFSTTGTYILWVQATNLNGCLSEPITKNIVVQNEVTVTASDPIASETPVNNGQFTVDLGAVNNTGGNITIHYTVSGSATSVTDYAVLSGSVVIPNGSQTATIALNGIVDDALVEGNETVVVTLTGSDHAHFQVSADPTKIKATITIFDNDSLVVPTVVSQVTNDTTPTITGTATVGIGEVLTVTVNGVTYTAGDGKLTLVGTDWTLQIPAGSEILSGTYPVTATVTDLAHNSSTDVSTNELIIDTTAPVVPTVVSQVTNDTTPTITGTATVGIGEVLTVTVNGVTYTAGDGKLALVGTDWTLQIPAGNEILAGTYPVTATVTDLAHNSSTDVSTGELIIDSTAPVVPTVVSQVTNDTTPTITGTATVGVGEVLTVTVNGVTYTAGDGKLTLVGTDWTLQIPAGSEILSGTYPVTATVTDLAHNSSTDVTTNELIIDTTAPVVPTVVSQVTNDTTPTITGTATVGIGEVLTVTVNGVTYTAGDGKLTLVGTDWTLQIPTGSEILSGTYPVTATVTDLSTNSSTDITTNELIIDTTAPVVPTVVSQVTNDTTPTITGTATVGIGEVLTVTVNGVTYTAGDGKLSLVGTDWTLQIPAGSEILAGTYPVTATVTDLAHNSSTDVSTGELIIDTTAPVVPTVVSQVTNDTTPTITGTATVGIGEVLTVTVNGVTYTAGDGKLTLVGTDWTLQIPAGSEILSGTYPVTATVTDLAHNSSTDVTTNELIIDTTAPVVPTVVSQVTNDTTPTITGTATVGIGEVLTVTVNGVTYTAGDGKLTLVGTDWTLQIPAGSEILSGTYPVTATVTDLAHNSSTDVSTGELIIDTTAPVVPTVVSQTTNDTTPTITGTATVGVGEVLTVTVNGVTYTEGDGKLTLVGTDWTLQIPAGSEILSGTYPVTATVTDLAHNSSNDVSTGELIIDTTAPVVPTVVSQVTNDTTPTITGTATVGIGEVLTVTVNGVTYTAGDGKLTLVGTDWTLQIPTGSEILSGTYPVTATVTDLAHNSSTDVSTGELIIDTTAPVVPTVVSQTTNDTTPTITGTATVGIGEVLTVTVNGVTYTAGDGKLTLVGTDWTLQIPTGSEILSGTYPVTATVTDLSTNSSTDITTNELIIDTTAPVVPTVVSQVTNDTTPAITGTATVGIGEVLTVTVNGVTYTAGDGKLTLVGTDWTLQIPAGSEILNGTYPVTAKVTDAATNSSTDISTNELIIDTTAPVVPTVVSQVTNDTTPAITGTATVGAGEVLTVTVNGVTYTEGDGKLTLVGTDWTLLISAGSEILAGTYPVTATVTDLAHNSSTDVSTGELIIDTTAPVVPTVVSQVTNDTTPTITGTATVGIGEVLTVTVNGVTYTEGDGKLTLVGTDWTLQIPAGSEILAGTYPVTATVTDLSTNSSTDITTNELIIDTTAPVVPTVVSQVTNDTTPTITGTATVGVGEVLTVTVNGVTYTAGDGKLTLAGTDWTLQIPAGSEILSGTYPVTATVADLSTNSSTDITTNELIIDTTAPVVPTVVSQVTNDTTPTITGTATVGIGEVLTVTVNGVTYTAGDGKLSLVGTDWTLQIPAGSEIPNGTYPVTAKVTDPATNVSTDITTNELKIRPLPTLSLVSTVCSVDYSTYTINFTSDGTVTSPSGIVIGNQVTGIPSGTNVTLLATSDGLTKTLDVTAPVCTCPSVTAPVSDGNKIVCEGTSIPNLTVTVGAGETADWYKTNSGGIAVLTGSTSYTSPEIVAGNYTYFAETRNTSSGCKSSERTEISLTILNVPERPTVGSVITNKSTSVLNALFITNNSTPLITGTASVRVGETLTVEINGVKYIAGDGKLTLSGTKWTLAIPSVHLLKEGVYPVTVSTSNALCNSVDNTTNELIIDITAPVIPTVVSQNTNDTTPLITGTATVGVGEILTVTVNGVDYTSGDGKLTLTGTNWTLQIPAGKEILDGTYPVSAKVTDAAGNESTDVTFNELIIDTTTPFIPTVVSQVTNDTTPTITGTATVGAGEVLTVTVNGVTYTEGDGKLTLAGTDWTLQIPAGSEILSGTYPVTATVTDLSTNSSTDITTNELIIDTTAPVVPTVVSQVTNDTTPAITGTATVGIGEVLTVTVNGVTYTAGDGKLTLVGTDWTLQIPAGSEILSGTYPVTAKVTDAATNSSTDITANELIIDTTAPVIPTVVSQVTNDTTPAITGTATVGAGEVLTVTVNGVTYTEGDGKLTLVGTDWRLQIPAGSEILIGTYPVTAKVTDLATNSSTDITTNELSIRPLPTLIVSGTTCSIDLTTYTIDFTSSGTVTSTAGIVSGNQVKNIPSGTNVTLTSILDGLSRNLDVTAPDCSCPSISSPESVGNMIFCTGSAIPALTVTVGAGETADWFTTATGGSAILSSNTSFTSAETYPGTYQYYAEARNIANGCKSSTRTAVSLTVINVPERPEIRSIITNKTTPVITGTAVIRYGETLTVEVNGINYKIGDGKLTLNGTTWTLTVPSVNVLREGIYQVTATATNGLCSSVDNNSNELIIDTTAPAIPTVVSQITRDTTPLITGTAKVGIGETFTVTVNGVTYTAGDGKLTLTGYNWTLQIPAEKEIFDGTYPVTAKVTDAAGNISTDNSTSELIIDTIAPVIPTVVSQITTDTTPLITGTATVKAGETLTVTVNGITYTVGDGKLTLTGTKWTLQIPAGKEILDGTYPVTATVTDAANNSSTDVSTGELIIDTIAPVIPTVISQITSDTTPLITGTATVGTGETLTVTVNGITYTAGDGKLTLSGTNWTLQIPAANKILDGTYPVTAKVTDAAGNNSTDISSGELIIDTITPVIPTVISQITNNATPLIKGTATVGTSEIFTVTVNGVTYILGDGKLTLTGNEWNLQIPAGSEISDGTYPVTAKVTDAAGNVSTDVTTNELIIDTKAPVIPTVVSQITSDTTPLITGTATVGVGETFKVTVNGLTYTDGDGKLTLRGTIWTLQIPAGKELPDGTYSITAKVTDAAGNVSNDISTGELIIDTSAPVIPTVVSQISNDSTPAITGTATVGAGEILIVTVNGITYTLGDGNLMITGTIWTLQIPAGKEILDGTYPVTAKVTDQANNISTDITTNELIIDTKAPVIPTVVSQITNNPKPLINGTATVGAGEKLKVTVNGISYTVGDGKLILTGTIWTLQIQTGNEILDGTYPVTATVTDAAGNVSTDVTTNELIIDTKAPAVPTVVSQITSDTTPVITGTAKVGVGEIFKVTINGITYTLGEGILTLTGINWSLQIPAGNEILSGTYPVTARVIDAASNISTDITTDELVIDTKAPVIPTVVSQTTSDNTPAITGTATVGIGEKLKVTVNGNTYSVGDGMLTITGAIWTLQIPDGNKLPDGTYPVTATVTDAAGNNSTDVTTNELVIDTIIPIVPTVVSQITNDTTPMITGTATAGAGETLTVTVNGVTYTAGDGKLTLIGTNWTLQVPDGKEIFDGTYPVTAKVTDATGNNSTDVTTNELIIDTKAPVIPTVVSQNTSNTTPLITGTATVRTGEILTVSVNGVTYTAGDGNLTLTGNIWSLQIPARKEILDGTYPVTAKVTDAAGNNSTDATTNELIIDTNKAPIAQNDSFSTTGAAVLGTLSNNDSDPEGDQLIYKTIPVIAPVKGILSIKADGTFIYTPKSNASGTDEFIYEVCDTGKPAKCTQAKVFITFNNQPPLAVNDNYTAEQGQVINGRMNLNDSDPDGNSLIYSTIPVVLPKHGNVSINADGTFNYTPEAGFVGIDAFTYEVCDNGIPSLCSRAVVSLQLTKAVPVNHAPMAVNDINNTLVNISVSGNVLTNDSDPDGDELLLNTKPVTLPLNGKVVISANGNYTYTPNAGFVGEDYFTYSVCDKNTNPSLCSDADVTIEVRDVAIGNRSPVANEDEAVVQSGKSVIIHVLANDFDPDLNPFNISRTPTSVSHGTLVQNVDGTFTYTPTQGFIGTDQFVYEICDNQSPSLCSRATVTIRVIAAEQGNLPPFAADDAYFTNGAKVTANLSLNDTDPDGNKLIYTITPLIAPAKGTLVISSNGVFEYTPNDNFAGGTDQFVYQVCDNGNPSACDKATVYITLIRKETPSIVNRLATNDVNATFKNIPVSGNVLINDAGFYGFASTVNVYLTPQKGTLAMAVNGEYTYTPNKDWIGTDNFYYIVCTTEEPADCDTVNVTIHVLNDNLAQIGPVANDDEMQTPSNTSVSGNVLANDFSPSGDQMELNTRTKSGPQHGKLVLSPDGTFTYAPASGFTGQDYFVYEVCGNVSGLCTTARVTITVSGNTAEMRLFADDDLYFSYSEAVHANMIANDTYPSVTTLKVNLKPIVPPTHGAVVISSNGTFIYTPVAGFTGTDQFVYEICDTKIGECVKATVYIMVKEKPTQYADLIISKSGPATVIPGGLISYKLVVTNLGTAIAGNVQINDYLPLALINPQFNLEGSTTKKDWTGYYQFDKLEINKPFTIFIQGTVSTNAPDTLKNLATVTSSTWDPILANNQSVVKTIVRRGPVARIQGAPYIAVGSCDIDGKILDGSKSGGEGLSYKWSPSVYLDNATSSKPVFRPGKSTRYTLTITDSKGLRDTASVIVSVMPAPKAVTDKNVYVNVPNATILLNGTRSTGAGLTYLWLTKEGILLNGETKSTAMASGLGMYYLQVTDSLGCMNRDSVNIGLYIQAINDTASTKVNESVIINVVKNDIPKNAINPSSISIVTPPLHGIASVSADSLILYMPEISYVGQDEFVYSICDYFRNCDNAKVLVLINDVPFYAPDAFSPNGDGINDQFVMLGLGKYQTVEIEIYNRWGNIVYQSKNYGDGKGKSGFWDGTSKTWDGKATNGLRIGSGPVPSGTYYYILTFNGKEKIERSVYLDR